MTMPIGNASPDRRALHRASLRVLVFSQVLGGAGLAAGITVGALLAEDMFGSIRFSGLPAALFTLGSAAAAMLVGQVSQRSGRRPRPRSRIAVADGLPARLDLKLIAGGIGKSFQTVCREVKRDSRRDGRYQPWWAHNEAFRRRQRPKPGKIAARAELATTVRGKLTGKWSPQQLARHLVRTHPDEPEMQVCAETIYVALFAGALGKKAGKLRTGRCRPRRHRRGVAEPNKIRNMRPIARRPAHVRDRVEPGHWEGDLVIGMKMTAAIGTLVERTSRSLILVHLPDGYKGATAARRADRAVRPDPAGDAQDTDLGPGPRDGQARTDRSCDRHAELLLRPALTPGNDRRTRTRMGLFVSTSPSTPTSRCTPRTTSHASQPSSTNDPDSCSATGHPTPS